MDEFRDLIQVYKVQISHPGESHIYSHVNQKRKDLERNKSHDFNNFKTLHRLKLKPYKKYIKNSKSAPYADKFKIKILTKSK